jgi:alpha-L-rhamnosidase
MSRLTRPLAAVTVASALALAGLVAIGAGAPAAARAVPAVQLDDLQTNGRTDPLGIPGDAPSLSWHGESALRAVTQTGYQVQVATSTSALASADDLWDTGQVDSDRQVDVPYGGPQLRSHTRYYWRVRTWDDGATTAGPWSDPASFETGLLTASDWQGQWIGAGVGDSWADYTTKVEFHINTLGFGVYFRSKDAKNAYMWELTTADGSPHIKVHKLVNGAYTVIANAAIQGVTTKQLLTGDHTLAIAVRGSAITTSLDGSMIDQRSDTTFDHGRVGLRTAHATQGDESVNVHSVSVVSGGNQTLLSAGFDDGSNPFTAGSVTGGDLVMSGNQDAWLRRLPLLRDQFTTSPGKTIESARLYASARGVYQLSIDGKPVGDSHLAPGASDYAKRIQSQTYDVTKLVQPGANAIGAALGAGWYAGRDASLPPGHYGIDPSLLAQLQITYTDGTSQVVASDPSWTWHTGPFVQGDNIDGETYDARLEQHGFDTAGFDASGWAPVSVAPSATSLVVPQPDEPVRTTQELPALSRTQAPAGSYIYDLGQNMVGVGRVTISGHAGDTVRIRYGEVLNPDGTLYTANLRSAKATDHYTFAADGTVTYTPTFTFHGFRYVEITGASTPPAVSDVKGEVWGSDLPATGTLHTSDGMLNQLTSNISWGQRGNFLSIPTDTPARDERLGWLGDINVFAPTASYLRDTRAFMAKFSADMRDAQRADGSLPGTTPDLGLAAGGAAWEDAIVTVPYAVYWAYGDTSLIQQNYAAMQAFYAHTQTSAGADLIDTGRDVYGDWLAPDAVATTAGLIATAYDAEDARMMSEMAASLGKDADAATYAQDSEQIRAAFAAQYVKADGTVGQGSQTSYALALGMNLVPQDQRAAVGAKFVAKVHADGDHLATGFVGTPWLLPALSSIGQDALAYTILEGKTYPSWGYEISKGATTMWERWNSIQPDGSFGDVAMNSFNHYAYGAVGSWMYQHIGGISAESAGYKKIRIAPSIGGGLSHGEGSYDSAYGTIASRWQTADDGDLLLHVEVPVNTTADIVLPATDAGTVTESGHLLGGDAGVASVTTGDGTMTATVGSGTYDFTVSAADVRLQKVLDGLDSLSAQVARLSDRGDMAAADHSWLDGTIGDARQAVSGAISHFRGGDQGMAGAQLAYAADTLANLRSWLPRSTIDLPDQPDLDRSVAAIQDDVLRVLTGLLGVYVSLPPTSAPVGAHNTVYGTLEVSDVGSTDLTGLQATVSVGDWGTTKVSLDRLAAGASAQLPVSLQVPAHVAPGSYDAQLTLRITVGSATYSISDTTSGWVSVTSGLTLGAPSWQSGTGDPSSHADLVVPVTNGGTDTFTGDVRATLPDGWSAVPGRVVVPPGQTVNADIPVVVPLDVVAGPVVTTVSLEDAGRTFATADAQPSFALTTPPAGALDHVDFGNSASESSHAVQSSASSGTSTEAGLTRRYANVSTPGSWFSAQVQVPPGQPFVLRDIETFNGAYTKKYDVYVNDTLVKTQLVPRTDSGQGTKTYDARIDDPAILAGDGGTVRVKLVYPQTGASGFYDPSIADMWVMGVPADTHGPDAGASITSGTIGDNGWYRSAVQVTVHSQDAADPAPEVQTGTDAGWQEYDGPLTVAGDGKHTLSFRATDAAGRSSGARSIPVWVDTVAPSTELAVTTTKSPDALVGLSATDATSGVASTTYRVDGGPWRTLGSSAVEVSGLGDHTIEYASTDEAGNVEAMHHATLTLTAAADVAALLAPSVTGQSRVGATLRSTRGSWNTRGLRFTRHWLRDGRRIRGATHASYVVRRADRGHRLSMEVTARRTQNSGVSTSERTPRVRPRHRG